MKLDEQVIEVVLSMTEQFTMQQLIAKLAEENLFIEGQKQRVLDILDEYLDRGIINHIPYTDKYYV